MTLAEVKQAAIIKKKFTENILTGNINSKWECVLFLRTSVAFTTYLDSKFRAKSHHNLVKWQMGEDADVVNSKNSAHCLVS